MVGGRFIFAGSGRAPDVLRGDPDSDWSVAILFLGGDVIQVVAVLF